MSLFGPPAPARDESVPGHPDYRFADVTYRNLSEYHQDFPERTSESLVLSIIPHLVGFPIAKKAAPWLEPPTKPDQKAYSEDCTPWAPWSTAEDYTKSAFEAVIQGTAHLYLVYHYKKTERVVDGFMFWDAKPVVTSNTDMHPPLTRARDAHDDTVVLKSGDYTRKKTPNWDTAHKSLLVDIRLIGANPHRDAGAPKNLAAFLMGKLRRALEATSFPDILVYLESLNWKIARDKAACDSGEFFGLDKNIYEPLGFEKNEDFYHLTLTLRYASKEYLDKMKDIVEANEG